MSKSVTVAIAAFIAGAGCASAVSQVRGYVEEQFANTGTELIKRVMEHGRHVTRVDGATVYVYVGKDDGECTDPPDPTFFEVGFAALSAQYHWKDKFQVVGDSDCRPM